MSLYHGLREGAHKCDSSRIPPNIHRRAHLPLGPVDLAQGAGDLPIFEIPGRRRLPPPGEDSPGHGAPPHTLEQVTHRYELIEPTFEGDDRAFLAYFEVTYIGRTTNSGRRRPAFDRRIWNLGRRMRMGPIRANNAIESFRCPFDRAIAQAGHPAVYRFVESLQLEQNIARGAINISPKNSERSRSIRD